MHSTPFFRRCLTTRGGGCLAPGSPRTCADTPGSTASVNPIAAHPTRSSRTTIPSGAVMDLAAAREVKLLDLSDQLDEMRKLDEPVRSVVIAGGGNIGFRLARALEAVRPGGPAVVPTASSGGSTTSHLITR